MTEADGGLRGRARAVLFRFPAALGRLGLVDRERGTDAFDLALPVMVTGTVRTVLRTADFFMVGLALSSAAVAGLEFAFQYYFVGFGLALALSSGTISVVSRAKGAGRHDRADLAIKQSLWLAVILSAPLVVVAQFRSEFLVGVLTNDPVAIEQGATYLRIVTYALLARFWSMIAARALQGSGDTRTPMYVNLLTIPTNIGLNAALIFGLGPFPELGIAGAAWGTTVAETLSAVIFAGLLLSGRYDVRLRLGGKQWDATIAGDIVRVGTPLAGSRLVGTFGRFPFLFVLGVLGTPVVAAFAIGRRVIMLAMMPAWGYSTAASTLVGQALGAGDETDATAYGWDTTRIALVTQLLIAAVMVAIARPIATIFNPEAAAITASFVRVFALAVGGFSVARTLRGALRGAGDTAWPFYGKVLGLAARLSLVALALPAGTAVGIGGVSIAPGLGLGIGAVYAAIVVDYYVQAAVNAVRFRSGKWRLVARRPSAGGVSGDD
ncbi:MATE family efflux transporter [Halopiger goleimassiliensis]|uniref:MATE family efflux transporter n=1 Tax=Halopiger goleimassiliensis TaxID=1293048 RepID=UPI0006778F81|nr:MATE family efflux transporter [Halopiger goleimassiliensis]